MTRADFSDNLSGMSPARKWNIVFIVGTFLLVLALVYQAFNYNQKLTQEARDQPPPKQYIFLPPSSKTNALASAPVRHDGPYVEQTAYSVQENTPSTGSFTCNVTLKNTGGAKAVNVQVSVHPYRGTRTDDEDRGPNLPGVTLLDDTDYRAQVCTWVPFPDLAPGESSTQTVVFLMRSDVKPGPNPSPEIIFEPDKAAKPPASRNPANN